MLCLLCSLHLATAASRPAGPELRPHLLPALHRGQPQGQLHPMPLLRQGKHEAHRSVLPRQQNLDRDAAGGALIIGRDLPRPQEEVRRVLREVQRAHLRGMQPHNPQPTQGHHDQHGNSAITQKVHADRTALKDALQKNDESYQDSKRAVERLKDYESQVESNFLDNLMEISVFYKHIIEAITALQEKEV